MAKRRRKIPTTRKPTRKERSRAAREARANRWIIGGAITVGVLLIGVLAYGYISEVIIKGRQPVATVNGEPIPAKDWQARVRELRRRLEIQLNAYQQQRMAIDPSAPSADLYIQQLDQEIRTLQTQLSAEYETQIGQQVLQQMAQEEIYRQEAERLGISVTPGEVDQSIEQFFGYDRSNLAGSSSPETGTITDTTVTTPTTGMTEQEFETQYEDYVNIVLKPTGLGVEGFRAMMEASLLGQKIREQVTSGVPTEAEQVDIRYIAFPTEEEAFPIVERLEQGEAWEAIQEEIEANEEGAAYVTDMEWRTERYLQDQFGEEIAQSVFAAEVGSRLGPLAGQSGRTYVIEVTAHEMHELDEFMLSYEKSAAFEEWLTQQMQGVEFSENWQEKLP